MHPLVWEQLKRLGLEQEYSDLDPTSKLLKGQQGGKSLGYADALAARYARQVAENGKITREKIKTNDVELIGGHDVPYGRHINYLRRNKRRAHLLVWEQLKRLGLEQEYSDLSPVRGSEGGQQLPALQEYAHEHREKMTDLYQPTDRQRAILSSMGLQAVQTNPNGNCLFEAVLLAMPEARQLYPTPSHLRAAAADYLYRTREHNLGFLRGDLSLDDQLAELRQDGVYLNAVADMVPMALSDLLRRRLHIINENGTRYTVNPRNIEHSQQPVASAPQTPIVLIRLNAGGGHYLGSAANSSAERVRANVASPHSEPTQRHIRPGNTGYSDSSSNPTSPENQKFPPKNLEFGYRESTHDNIHVDLGGGTGTEQSGINGVNGEEYKIRHGRITRSAPVADEGAERVRSGGTAEDEAENVEYKVVNESEVLITWTNTNPDADILQIYTTRKAPAPIDSMNDAFPWRDPTDPVGRVYRRYAGADGQVHPVLRGNAKQITAKMTTGKQLLRKIANSNTDTRMSLHSVTNDLWAQLENDVAAEVARLTEGQHRPMPVEAFLMTTADLLPHEQMLNGHFGLRLTDDVMNTVRAGDRSRLPSAANGRILGLYLGAVLDSREKVEEWSERYEQFPHYAIETRTSTGRLITMTGERVCNVIGFANTALLADASAVDFDHSRINAIFLTFSVRFPHLDDPTNPNARGQRQEVAALVALDNAFDLASNPGGFIIANYGEGYLGLFDESGGQPAKTESEDVRLSEIDSP